jgi:hypothetical protein
MLSYHSYDEEQYIGISMVRAYSYQFMFISIHAKIGLGLRTICNRVFSNGLFPVDDYTCPSRFRDQRTSWSFGRTRGFAWIEKLSSFGLKKVIEAKDAEIEKLEALIAGSK